MNDNTDNVTELAIADLEAVTGGAGGAYQIGMGVQRGFVDSLKGMASRPNVHDGHLTNGLRGYLTPQVSGKVRPWMGGHSIDSVTRPMQLNGGQGLPTYRWSP